LRTLIVNGHIVDPTQNIDTRANLFIEDGKVSGLLKDGDGTPEGAQIVDASGLIVSPGFIDLHVHLREPGQEYKETIDSGTAAAIAGGWTSVCAMPNTDPVNDNPAVTRFIIEQAEHAAKANVFPIGAITKQSMGVELAEIGEMKRAGIVAISDDGRSVPSAGLMRLVMEYARGFDLTVVDHCEDRSLSSGGVMHEGISSLKLGLRGIPALAEEIDALRDCQLSELTGSRVHLAHVSTRGALEAVRRAKEIGLPVTCEVTPHHWSLTDRAVEGYDTNTKVNPPLRSDDHIEAILEGLSDGTIDCIATDHAPHHMDEKALEYDRAAFGMIGLETAVGLALNKLVHKGIISIRRLVELCSVNPAKAFGLELRGSLRKGFWGDVTLIDPNLVWTYDVSKSKSKSRNSPFHGFTFKGAPAATIVAGRVVYQNSHVKNFKLKNDAAHILS
jgi:dihydroorotase